MCTVSWFVGDGEYSVFFNRDENRTRPVALPPAIYINTTQQHIMPLDPQGGGSWLAVNSSGFSFALLNFYQGRLPKGRLHSRGLIVRELVCCFSLQEVENWLRAQELQKFAPFSLLVFPPELVYQQSSSPSVPLYRWTGKQLELQNKTSPYFSSAVEFERVCQLRERVYDDLVRSKQKLSTPDFLQLHKSHLPEKSRSSICMHREDASTVSFSQISVNNSAVHFYYSDGAPCETHLQKPVSLSRLAVNRP